MDKTELKRKLLNTTMFEEIAKEEILKKMDLIDSYKIETEIENLETLEDGTIEYDVIIHHKITPKTSVDNIVIDFDVTPHINK